MTAPVRPLTSDGSAPTPAEYDAVVNLEVAIAEAGMSAGWHLSVPWEDIGSVLDPQILFALRDHAETVRLEEASHRRRQFAELVKMASTARRFVAANSAFWDGFVEGREASIQADLLGTAQPSEDHLTRLRAELDRARAELLELFMIPGTSRPMAQSDLSDHLSSLLGVQED